MAKSGTWADHVVVINMAKMLQRDIRIVTSSPSTSGNDCLVWVPGDRSGKNAPLLLGHMWENHYQSLQPIEPTVTPLFNSTHATADLPNGGSKHSCCSVCGHLIIDFLTLLRGKCSTILAEKQNGHSKDSPQVRNQDCDGHSDDWLRDKIGSYFSIPFLVGLKIVCKYLAVSKKILSS